MKIIIKKKFGLLINAFFGRFLYSVALFIGVFVVGMITLSIIYMEEMPSVLGRVTIISAGVSLVYLLYGLIDTYLYSRDSSLELTTNSINIIFSGLKKGTQTIPLSDVRNIIVHQSFLDRVLGIARVVITQITTSTTMAGFDYREASALMSEFNNKHR